MVDLKAMQKEIDEMEKALEEPEAGAEEFRTDAPGTQAPGTQAPGTESPGTEAPGTEAPGTQAPSTEAPAEDSRDKELRELREELEKLKEGPKSTKAPGTKAPSTEPPIGEEDFIGEIDLDDLTRDPKQFNQILNTIYKKAREAARGEIKGGIESVIRSIPDITKNTIAVQAQLAKARDDFYKENKDLLPWSKSVAAVMEEMIAENPDKRYDELLPSVATEVRKRLNLQKQADKKNDKDNPPPLPKGKRGQRSTPNPDLSELDKSMDEMDKALGLD
jgi:hypothetical protein